MLTAKNFHMDGPCCDIQTHNLILRVMGERGKDPYGDEFADDDEFDEFEHASEKRRDYLSDAFGFLTGKEDKKGVSQEETSAYADKIKEMLEKKGKAFLHTLEYFAALQDQDERMKAYRALKVSNIPSGEETEIAENPFKFLNLPEDATYGQTRAAWIMLSKMYYPDMMYPENCEQYERLFGKIEFPLEGKDYDSWMKQIEEIMPPERLSTGQVEKLSPKEREEYTMKHESYRKKELEYEKVKSDMRLRATEKMKIINKAYREAKKRFSKEERESFAGFVWEKGTYDDDFLRKLMCHDPDDFTYDMLCLEGEGEIRKDTGRYKTFEGSPYLSFDYGDVYLHGYDYRQLLPLKPFFAWTEIVQGKELCPTLLDDVVKFFKLGDHQSEQLRLMIMNREKSKFILDTLSLSEREESYVLRHFLEEIYEGPTFGHFIGPMRAERVFPLGVEFTPEGAMVLNYKAQEDQMMSWWASEKTDQFSPTDMKMALAIAYGPLLAMD